MGKRIMNYGGGKCLASKDGEAYLKEIEYTLKDCSKVRPPITVLLFHILTKNHLFG